MGGLGESTGTETGFYSSTSTFPSRHSTKTKLYTHSSVIDAM